jgi:2,3-bisphosphoglycerate-dependent phosphoglycerate mutase
MAGDVETSRWTHSASDPTAADGVQKATILESTSVPSRSSSAADLAREFEDHSTPRRSDSFSSLSSVSLGRRAPWRIILVRHGESEANVQKDLYKRMADHAIPLTEEGHRQARVAGEHVKNCLERAMGKDRKKGFDDDFRPSTGRPHVRLWSSPYQRTRETAEHIKDVCRDLITDSRENVMLAEQQFGLFEGLSASEIREQLPREYHHYAKAIKFGGRYWARIPMGESRFDVCRRVHEAFGTFHRDRDHNAVRYLVVVTHGVTLRAFVMMWRHLTPEWMEDEPNPQNCCVRCVAGHDRYFFNGFAPSGAPEDAVLMSDSVSALEDEATKENERLAVLESSGSEATALPLGEEERKFAHPELEI